MQTRSNAWESSASLFGDTILYNITFETKLTINNTVYTRYTAPVISRGLMQGGLSIGNAVSANCSFSVQTTDTIPKGAQIFIQMRYVNDGTATEWLPAGTFYVSHQSYDPIAQIVTIDGYDALLKGNALYDYGYPWTDNNNHIIMDNNGNALFFAPVTMTHSQAVTAIASLLGVSIDSRTNLQTGDDYVITPDINGTAIRDVLGAIAAANAGNWIITPANKLLLVPVRSRSNPGSPSNAVIVRRILGSMTTTNIQTISGVRIVREDGSERLLGSSSGVVVTYNEVAGAGYNAAFLRSQLVGKEYQAFSFTGAYYDPALEMGDYTDSTTYGVQSIIANETITLGPSPTGNISAPESDDLADEYPYISNAVKNARLQQQYTNKAVSRAMAHTDEAIQMFDNSLTQQEVFDRLTGGGVAGGMTLDSPYNDLGADAVKQLYFSGTYVDRGIISDKSGKNYWILDDGARSGEFVTRKGKVGGFTLEDGALVYSSTGEYARLATDGVSFEHTQDIGAADDGLYGVQLSGRSITFEYDGEEVGEMEVSGASIGDGAIDMALRVDGVLFINMYRQLGDTTGQYNELTLYQQTICNNGLTVIGDMDVTGTKSRVVATDSYAARKLYAYETPAPYFGDIGEGVIADDGKCYVWLDPILAETISTKQYQVFIQRYGSGDCYVSERTAGYFIVTGTPGLAFGWELKAKQRDFDQRRFDRVDITAGQTNRDYGAFAAKHLENLQKARATK